MEYEANTSNKNGQSKLCGCKGIRSCRLCEGSEIIKENRDKSVYSFCLRCSRAWTDGLAAPCDFPMASASNRGKKDNGQSGGMMKEITMAAPVTCDYHRDESVNFSGVVVIENFVTEDEETALCDAVYLTDFVNSQSGRRKQDYGPKVNFKRKKLKFADFNGLPSYSQFLYERMKEQEALADFEPVELCNLEYCRERGAHIDPHFDDAWLWGERLITLNLLSDCTLTFTSDSHPDAEVRVPLPRWSLIIVQGAARHQWKHGISRADVSDKRIAMTFRELSDEFRPGGGKESEGSELLKLALTFQGCAIGVS